MSLPAAYFDRLYAAAPDPWSLSSRWYEARKYALTMAGLPQPSYRCCLEAGCSVGALTEQLAGRCAQLLAVDCAAAAVAAARARTGHLPQVRVEQRTLPAKWPTGTFDLVVLSEIGYYLDDAELAVLLVRSIGALTEGGTLVAVHWRHPVADYPRSGDEVHAALADQPGLHRLVRHEEADFLLEVYLRGDARSVAAQTGLL